MAGNYIQTRSNNASLQAQTNAKNAALQEGLKQQQQRQQEATGVLNKTLEKFSAPAQEQGLGDIIAARTAAIQKNTTPAAPVEANIKAAPQVVQSDLAKKMSSAAAYGAQQAGALGAMGATGDMFGNNAIALNDNGLNLNTVANFAKGELDVNRLKQQVDYNNARRAPNTWGNILSTLGQGMSLAGAGSGAAAGVVDGIKSMAAPGPSTAFGDLIWGASPVPPTSGMSPASTPLMV